VWPRPSCHEWADQKQVGIWDSGSLMIGANVPSSSPQVFQRREDGSVNFFRGWEAYREGFGKLTGEHWLGESPTHPPGHLLGGSVPQPFRHCLLPAPPCTD
jgi:hypothetical protein